MQGSGEARNELYCNTVIEHWSRDTAARQELRRSAWRKPSSRPEHQGDLAAETADSVVPGRTERADTGKDAEHIARTRIGQGCGGRGGGRGRNGS